MSEPESKPGEAGRLRRLAKTLVATGHNRVELLLVELKEEQQHLLRLLFLGIVAAVLGLLSSIAFSAALVVVLWNYSPAGVLAGLGLFYALVSWWLCRRISILQANWKSLEETSDQIQKDRLWLEKELG